MDTRSGHRIEEALRRSGLTEEEACIAIRIVGGIGYNRSMRRLEGPWKAARKWLVWFGGWEIPEMMQWDMGYPAWQIFARDYRGRFRLYSPMPVAMFGHRFTLFGRWWEFKVGRGWLVFSSDYAYEWPSRIYWSPNGTPWHSGTRFFWRKKANSG